MAIIRCHGLKAAKQTWQTGRRYVQSAIRKKGITPMTTTMPDKFAWQKEFEQKFFAHAAVHFFLCALPGAGKTRAAIRVMKKLKEQGYKFVIVVPTTPVKKQWKKAARQYGRIELMDGKDFMGGLRDPSLDGIVLTYSACVGRALALRMFCASNPVFVVMDEIHHTAQTMDSVWGQSINEAFVGAKRGLQLSGTPLRSDCALPSFLNFETEEAIPDFLEPEDSSEGLAAYKMDFEYDWPKALMDGVVRKIVFQNVASEQIRVIRETGKRDIIGPLEDEWLSKIIKHPSYCNVMLREGKVKLDEILKTDPSAAGMIVVENTKQASIILKRLRQLGERAIEVHTEAEETEAESSAEKLAAFTNESSPDRWVVAVRQVSEGVDIPRLRVCLYLTNITTELQFRQIAGRIVRRREKEKEKDAIGYMFIPETPRLTVIAKKIEELQAVAIRNIEERGPPIESLGPREASAGDIVTGISDPYLADMIVSGREFPLTDLRYAMERYNMNEAGAATFLTDFGVRRILAASGTEPLNDAREDAIDGREPEGESPEDQMIALQKEINKLITRYAREQTGVASGPEFQGVVKALHNQTNPVPGKQQSQLSIAELREKKERVAKIIAARRLPA